MKIPCKGIIFFILDIPFIPGRNWYIVSRMLPLDVL